MPSIESVLQHSVPKLQLKTNRPFHTQPEFDSLSIMNLVTNLEQTFHIEIFPEDLIPENFSDIQSIESLVRRNGGHIDSTLSKE